MSPFPKIKKKVVARRSDNGVTFPIASLQANTKFKTMIIVFRILNAVSPNHVTTKGMKMAGINLPV